jgi:hypothetical protein
MSAFIGEFNLKAFFISYLILLIPLVDGLNIKTLGLLLGVLNFGFLS